MLSDEENEVVRSLERPDDDLLKYYFLVSLLAGPFFPILLLPLFFRFRTLRYRFDDEGVSMRWGLLFRREISLTYSRIQDIHLASNAVERFFGLGRVLVQTASGAAKAEMTVEGLKEFEQVRDFLYSRMRGAREAASPRTPREQESALASGLDFDRLTVALEATAHELETIRKQLAASSSAASPVQSDDA